MSSRVRKRQGWAAGLRWSRSWGRGCGPRQGLLTCTACVPLVGWASTCLSASLGAVGPWPSILERAEQEGALESRVAADRLAFSSAAWPGLWAGRGPDGELTALKLHFREVPGLESEGTDQSRKTAGRDHLLGSLRALPLFSYRV